MKTMNPVPLAAIALIIAFAVPAAAGTPAGADLANDHLLYFVTADEAAGDTARPAGPEDFADLYNDHLLYFVSETPKGMASSASSRGTVDYDDPGEWPLTPDNFL